MRIIAGCVTMSMVALSYSCGDSGAPRSEEVVESASAPMQSTLQDPPDDSARFTLFEAGQVRPLALSKNKKTLFAVNTPDNRLEIFNVTHAGLTHLGSVS